MYHPLRPTNVDVDSLPIYLLSHLNKLFVAMDIKEKR